MNTVRPLLTRIAADTVPFETLLATWNEGFRGYFIPFQLDAAGMRRHLALGSIDLARSCLWLDGDTPMAVALAGVRGRRSWLGGLAIAPDWRGRGLSLPVVREFVDVQIAAASTGIDLEVLTQNWAARTYEQAGFIETRLLRALGGRFSAAACAGEVLDRETALHASRTLPREPACWQRAPEALQTQPDLRPIGVFESGSVGAVAWVRNDGERLRIVDAAARPSATAALVAALAAEAAGRDVLLVHQPDDALCAALQAAGLGIVQTLREMRRAGA